MFLDATKSSAEHGVFEQLSKAGIAVGYHGRFANGRIESWLNNYQPLQLEDMSDPDIYARCLCVSFMRVTFEPALSIPITILHLCVQ